MKNYRIMIAAELNAEGEPQLHTWWEDKTTGATLNHTISTEPQDLNKFVLTLSKQRA